MVHFMQRSQRFRELMQDLFAGTQSYLGLRNRLLRSLNGGVHEAVMQFFLDRVIPEVRVIPETSRVNSVNRCPNPKLCSRAPER